MYLAIARFPAMLAEQERDFQDWFTWSHEQLRESAGLKARRLLGAPDGSYAALVEHDRADTFEAMHLAESVSMIHRGLGKILDRSQAPTCEVVVDSPAPEGCCGGHGTASQAGVVPAQASGGCGHDA